MIFFTLPKCINKLNMRIICRNVWWVNNWNVRFELRSPRLISVILTGRVNQRALVSFGVNWRCWPSNGGQKRDFLMGQVDHCCKHGAAAAEAGGFRSTHWILVNSYTARHYLYMSADKESRWKQIHPTSLINSSLRCEDGWKGGMRRRSQFNI